MRIERRISSNFFSKLPCQSVKSFSISRGSVETPEAVDSTPGEMYASGRFREVAKAF
jgi:hypothetical protein